jgi:hypothetical protein
MLTSLKIHYGLAALDTAVPKLAWLEVVERGKHGPIKLRTRRSWPTPARGSTPADPAQPLGEQ